MNHRHPGQSGLVVTEISYDNWITHGSQVSGRVNPQLLATRIEERGTSIENPGSNVQHPAPLHA
jgi:hypothetical protein